LRERLTSDAFGEFKDSIPWKFADGSSYPVNAALYCNSIIRQAIYKTALLQDVLELQEVVKNAVQLDIDIALLALDDIPRIWEAFKSPQVLQGLVELYVNVIEGCSSAEVRSIALDNLAEMLDKQSRLTGISSGLINPGLSQMWPAVQDGKGSPQLSNSKIRISGSMMLYDISRSPQDSPRGGRRLESWGELLSGAGNANHVSLFIGILDI